MNLAAGGVNVIPVALGRNLRHADGGRGRGDGCNSLDLTPAAGGRLDVSVEASVIGWLESWDEARARARATGRPIFLFLHSPT